MTIRAPAPPANLHVNGEQVAHELARMVYDLRDQIPMFTLYDHPLDHPEHVVARLWVTLPQAVPCDFMLKAPYIEDLQALLMFAGLHRLERAAQDDPAIMEVWL